MFNLEIYSYTDRFIRNEIQECTSYLRREVYKNTLNPDFQSHRQQVQQFIHYFHSILTIFLLHSLGRAFFLITIIKFQLSTMKLVICLALAVLAAFHGTGINAAPAPAAVAELAVISNDNRALGKDTILGPGGVENPANPKFAPTCILEKHCARDNEERSIGIRTTQLGMLGCVEEF